MKKIASVLALALSLSLVLTACGSKEEAPAASTNTPAASTTTTTTTPEAAPAEGEYTWRTSADNKVASENGTFGKENISGSVLVTSVGQSADVSMLDALMKKVGAEYTFNATASADEVANYGTLILASGASSKGLGAAGISQEDELARAQAIADACKANNITVIVAHLGGSARRGALSDQFNDLALTCADYLLVVEDGNAKDSKFTDAGVPITLLSSIADAMVPLTELFGA